jgi:hypothetical protein
MEKPDLFDVVELQDDLPEFSLNRGAQGTVVECYPDGEYEVEFVDDDGQTLALCALPLEKISLIYQAQTKQKRRVLQQLFSIINDLDEERARKVVDFADSLR